MHIRFKYYDKMNRRGWCNIEQKIKGCGWYRIGYSITRKDVIEYENKGRGGEKWKEQEKKKTYEMKFTDERR